VRPTFAYGGMNAWIPSGGTYTIASPTNCYATLLARRGTLTAYAKTFVDRAVLNFGERQFVTNWVNAHDLADGIPMFYPTH
jgi:hypothetical protein